MHKGVKYRQMIKIERNHGATEEIYVFPDGGALPLRLLMAGITYPDPAYCIERTRSRNRFFVFEYVIEGSGWLTIEGKKMRVCAGDTYILTPGTEESYCADKADPFKKIWANIESAYLGAVLEAHGLTHGAYHFDSHPYLAEILKRAKNGDSTAAVSFEIAPIVLSLIATLSQKYEAPKEKTPAQRAKAYIDRLDNAPFSPQALAEELHVSLSTLTRAFRKAYGETPYEYYLSGKERAAKSLLQNTGLSAKEIAYRLGFADEHYFSNFFKKRTRLRPAEYKKGHLFKE